MDQPDGSPGLIRASVAEAAIKLHVEAERERICRLIEETCYMFLQHHGSDYSIALMDFADSIRKMDPAKDRRTEKQ